MTDRRIPNKDSRIAGNLLANPGFEEADENGFVGWAIELSEGMYFRRETDPQKDYAPYWPVDVHGGADAVLLAGLRGGTARCSQEIDITGGQRHELSAWVKTYDSAGQGFGTQPGDMAGVELAFLDSAGKVISRRLVASTTRATQRYRKLGGSWKAPKGAVRMRFSLVVKIDFNHWHGCVRFDDCTLQETA